jgi:hypothetical protein
MLMISMTILQIISKDLVAVNPVFNNLGNHGNERAAASISGRIEQAQGITPDHHGDLRGIG